jgi:hypothetical protein
MPVKIRVRCNYLDCQHLDGRYCSKTQIELDPTKICLSFLPLEEEQTANDDDVEDELDVESWEGLEEAEDDDYIDEDEEE